jgi:hypothetical protein
VFTGPPLVDAFEFRMPVVVDDMIIGFAFLLRTNKPRRKSSCAQLSRAAALLRLFVRHVGTAISLELRNMELAKAHRETVERLHQCSASHFESVMVEEISRGQTLWKEDIEIFKLGEHPEAEWCYAWSYKDGGTEKNAALLQIPPIISPSAAVRSVLRTFRK